MQVREQVGLTINPQGVAHHVTVTAVAEPLSLDYRLGLISDLIVSAIAAFFALLIAYKRADSTAYKALALLFLVQAFNAGFNFTPPSTLKLVVDLLSWGLLGLGACCSVVFALYYPEDKPAGLRARMVRWLPLFYIITFAAVAYSCWHLIARQDVFDDVAASCFWGLSALVTLVALWDGWRSSAGTVRQRYAWLMMCIGASTLFTFLHNTQNYIAAAGLPQLSQLIFPAYEVALLSMEIGIAYAILKHRVFNFGFAINRTIFYTLSSLTILVSFGIIEWLFEHLLKFDFREANILIDGAIALSVYLAFHKIRHVFEHWLERLFFRRWHVNEAKLRGFIKHAAHITTAPALIAQAQAELQRFSDGASCVIYLQEATDNYVAVGPASSLGAEIDGNDRICIALRAELSPLLIDEQHAIHTCTLALPVRQRSEMYGFVLLGDKPNGEAYRPDEVAVLGFAAHQIGLDLHALRNELLQAELAAQAKRIELDAMKIQQQQNTIDKLQTAFGCVGSATT